MKTLLLQCSYLDQPHIHSHDDFTFLLLLLIALLFAGYVLAAFVCWQKQKKWRLWRTISFITGCFVAGLSVSPAIAEYAHHDFSGHMWQHLLLGMLAPIGLVLGSPVLLALQVLPKKAARLVSRLLGSPFFHVLSHPATALALSTGSMYLLYLTPLYNKMHDNSALHFLVHVHFLAAGYMFTWALIGPDPAPRRPGFFTRLLVLFISIAAHSYLSKFMFAYGYPRNSLHTEAEIEAAAKLMYYGGDCIELLLVIVLFATWYHKKGKPHYAIRNGMYGFSRR